MGMSKFQALLLVLLGKKRTFLLYNSLKIVLFECPSDSLRVDWLGNDGIYELGFLDCIINMSRGDLAGNRALVGKEAGNATLVLRPCPTNERRVIDETVLPGL